MSEDNKFPIINIFGGPGAGKSTAYSGLFSELKKRWVKVEMVHEYAKELVNMRATHLLEKQNFVFATQEYRQSMLNGIVDVGITEAPLLMSAFYCPQEYPVSFKRLVFDFYKDYRNINIFILRSHEYQEYGRIQNEEEADLLAEYMQDFLKENGIDYYLIRANDANPAYLCHWLYENGFIPFPEKIKPFESHEVPPDGWIKPMLVGEGESRINYGAAIEKSFIPEHIRTKGD